MATKQSPSGGGTNSNNPRDLERRIFVGNLPSSSMEQKDLQDLFSIYGKINAVSLFNGYGFVQFERVEEAEAAAAGEKGRMYKSYKLDVNMAAERRQNKDQSKAPPPPRRKRNGEPRESRPRSRSPIHGRGSRGRRSDGREPRPGGPPRDPSFDRYRGPEGREKDPRGDPSFRDEAYERFRDSDPDDYFRNFRQDPYRDPWNGPPREPEDGHAQRRTELYEGYYKQLQRRSQEAEKPVDCSIIVVNKVQNREYGETVGRKVRDLGMVVDLIFLNSEVSLMQALEDVSRARTPFAIIITQQHQVHRSCTVNILYGTPQEHRNMPMEDAVQLVAQTHEVYKVENVDKEREETARKAAEMADVVLVRELDRENHPVSLLPAITLLYEGRFVSPDELESLITYLRDKKDRLVRSLNPHAAVGPPAAAPPAQTMPPPSAPPVGPIHQQQQAMQANMLSLFNSGPAAAVSSSSIRPSMPPMRPSGAPPLPLGYGLPPGHMPPPQRPPGSGINFDNPSVQKALDKLSQNGPTPPGQGMGPPPSMYPPRHYPSF